MIVAVIVVVGGLVFLVYPNQSKAPTELPTTATPMPTATTPTTAPTTIPKPNPATKLTDEFQTIWGNYIVAVKAHDTEAVKNLSYQLSYACANVSQYQKECFENMDNLIKAVSSLNTKDFTIVWKDAKQAILLTEPKPSTFDGNKGFYQPRIFFAARDGAYKVLSVFPEWGRFANSKLVSDSQRPDFLKNAMLDSDKDGLTDMEENCDDGGSNGPAQGCVKTDPNKKDTDGDGWWDGIEPYFFQT